MTRNNKKFLKLIGNKLKEHRLDMRLTLDKVAKKAGLTTATIQRYESGDVSIPLVKFAAHCKALKVDAGALLNDAQAAVSRKK